MLSARSSLKILHMKVTPLDFGFLLTLKNHSLNVMRGRSR